MATNNYNKSVKKQSEPEIEYQTPEQRPLCRNNFILMAAAGVMIVVGFLLMLGSSTTTEAFNPDIFSTRRIIVGPAVSFLGFIFMAVAIIRRPKF